MVLAVGMNYIPRLRSYLPHLTSATRSPPTDPAPAMLLPHLIHPPDPADDNPGIGARSIDKGLGEAHDHLAGEHSPVTIHGSETQDQDLEGGGVKMRIEILRGGERPTGRSSEYGT